MKVSLPFQAKTQQRSAGLSGLRILLALLSLGLSPTLLLSEGSKDFVGYDGYRMFLDTRDPQQLKVYANVGETINVGSSHVGIQGGFIQVYRPDGTLAATFDNTGTSTGLGIINNNIQELEGPTGGGTSNGAGYVPGTVAVQAGQAGVWTVIFDYPTYQNTSFINILNNAPWTRGGNQPNSRRVVLAWDITVSTGAAGNQGGTLLEGRVYTNEHISLINGNGFNTSPIFYVLTEDGYLYQVNILDADPFRFPISSNSLGLVDANGNPIYLSKSETAFTRSDDPSSWVANNFYLYEPQAQDNGQLINNKIFFNEPSSDLPPTAQVTDVFRSNTHTTWLMDELSVLDLTDTYILGANPGGPPCAPGSFQFGKGAFFYFVTNLGGSITLQLDLNNNGSYDDPVDVTINDQLGEGLDSIFWNGFDGLGVAIPVQDSFQFNYQGEIRFGELHIALTDVENNSGGVTFNWLNAPANYADSLFYYDHSDPLVGGPVSGGGTPGNALPTTIPYQYTGNAGNDRYLDQWFFIDYQITSTPTYINIVLECVCENATPELTAIQSGDVCAGQDLILSAANTVSGLDDLTYAWTGPNNFTSSETIPSGDTSSINIPTVAAVNAGTYQVIATTPVGCADTLSLNVNVLPTPNAVAIAGGGSYCEGENVQLSATNTVLGFTTINFEWQGPGILPGANTGTVAAGDPIILNLPAIAETAEGTYTLLLTGDNGCNAEPISTTVTVNPTPVLSAVSGAGSYCEDDDVTLVASNSATGISTMICVWNGPNIFNVTQTIAGGDPITLPLTNVNNAFEGAYSVVCEVNGCTSNTATFDVVVNNAPEINGITLDGAYCENTSLTLTAMNVASDTGPINYTWTGPNPNNPLFPFTVTGADANGSFPVTIADLSPADAGTYTLVLTSAGGCESLPQSVDITVELAPNLVDIQGGGEACVGQDVTLSATNDAPGVGPFLYVWTGPTGTILAQGVAANDEPCQAVLTNVQVADSGIYTITKTSTVSGCVGTATVEVDVVNAFTLTGVTQDSTYCEFANVTLTADNPFPTGNATYTWTGPNNFTFTTASANGFPFLIGLQEIDTSQAGVYTLVATSPTGCQSEPVDVFVGVNPGVNIVDTNGGGTYCEGTFVTLSGTGEGSASSVDYTWTDPNGVVVASGTTTVAGPFDAVLPAPVTPGTYILDVTASNGCTDSSFEGIAVIPTPDVVILNSDSTLCNLDTLSLCGQVVSPVGAGTFDYVWTTPSGELITGSASGNDVFCDEILPLATFGEGLYTLVTTLDGCLSQAETFFLSLNANPVISQISGGGTYCLGETAELCFSQTNPAVDSFFYTCILPDGTQVNGVGGGSTPVCMSLNIPGFVCCSIESYEGCVSSLICTEIIYDSGVDLTVSSNGPVCENETLSLTGTNIATCTGTVDYVWTGPGGFIFQGTAPCAGPFPADVTSPESGEYCLVVTGSASCADTACINVVVNPVPSVVGGSISGGGEFCAGDTVSLSATVTIADNTDISYVWTLDGVAIPGESGTVPSGTTLTLDLGEVGTDDEGEYCLELTSSQGCVLTPDVCTQITVNPTPELTSVTGGGTYCEGLDVMLNGTGTPGLGTVTYTWTGPNFTFTGTAPSEGPFPATVSDIDVDQAGVYTLVAIIGDCESDPLSVVVEVNPKPIISNVSGGGAFCEGSTEELTFTIDPNGASSVTWMVSCPGMDTSGTVTQLTVITISIDINNASAGTCTITAESSDGCEAEPASQEFTIQELPTPVLTANPSIVCEGDVLTLSTAAQTGTSVSYEWFNNGVSLGTSTDPQFVVPNATSGNYTVTVFVDGCQSTSAPVSVSVLAAPVANDDEFSSSTPDPINGNVLTNDQANGAVVITILEGPNATGATVTVNNDGSFTYTPGETLVPTDEFVYQICQVDCPDACDEATVTIIYDVECIVPNIITPNGDDINDVLFINCLENDAYPNNRLRVFNRWGDEIAVFEPYRNEAGWDGTYGSDKKDVPASTYFYLLELDKGNGDDVKSGYVKVVR